MLASKMAYDNLPDDEKEAFIRERASFKHTLTETLKDCPGDITVLARALQAAASQGGHSDYGGAQLWT
jgi:hypothetical protein